MCIEPNKIFNIGVKENGKMDTVFAPHGATCITQERPGSDWKICFTNPITEWSHNYDVMTKYIEVPCGKCVECQTSRMKDWSTRIALDVEYFNSQDRFYFITLTYDDKHLPRVSGTNYPTLVISDYQEFLKRFRSYQSYHFDNNNVRFFCAGEYGTNTIRPHYHLLVWNCDIPDIKLHKISTTGNNLFTSDTISELWKFGFHLIGSGSIGTAMYTAKYVSKSADDRIRKYCDFTGAFPPFSRMSLKPGIAKPWLDALSPEKKKEIVSSEFFNIATENGGFTASLPRYMKRKIEDDFPDFVKRVSARKQEVFKSKKKALVDKLGISFEDYQKQKGDSSHDKLSAKNAFRRDQI